MDTLSEKLINTEGGIWTKNGFNGLYYIYSLRFYDKNSVGFSYMTSESEYGRPYTINMRRFGTFYIENNVLIINFHSVIGSRYTRPNYCDEPLLENIEIKMEIEIIEEKITVKEDPGKAFYARNPNYEPKDIEIVEYKLKVKQIFGNRQNETIEFIAERPVID
ncbi:hypothetical protein ACYULU_06380 [Breznakiellaceae bacterium SP9]